ncbi:hypothetical protein D6779_10810 [Candidatus Parcubacteria bacterium]|nr:MAG: hypothetical protein D6779_10810 [Candidatus Parcubacteria bacterium]
MEVSLSFVPKLRETNFFSSFSSATDDGERYGGAPILAGGYAGVRPDFMDVELDDYRIVEQ